jgi:sugar phosphate isomerase/epimerase
MRLGIFTRTFVRPNLGEVLDAVQSYRIPEVQFNLVCAGLDPLPDAIPVTVCDWIRDEMAVRGLAMAAVSGTYNMAHPDRRKREADSRRLGVLIDLCTSLGTSVITLCSGTRDQDNMWRYHPANATQQAWHDMRASMVSAVGHAEAKGITLVVEPEVSNIVDSAQKARRLLDELDSDRLKIVIDAANLFPAGTINQQHEILDAAFQLLGEHIVMAHAKDLKADGAAGHEAAGTGLLDYDYYISLLRDIGFSGPLVMHSLHESQVADTRDFLERKLAAATTGSGDRTPKPPAMT